MAYEVKTIAQHAERLHDGRVKVRVADEVRLRALLRPLVMRNLAHDGNRRRVLHVTSAVDVHVQQVLQPKDGARNHQTNYQANQQDNRFARLDRRVASKRPLHEAHVSLVDGRLQGHLLAFVEQVSIERRFQFLLAFDVEALLLLLRHRSHLSRQSHLVFASLCKLHLHRAHITIDRGNERTAHRGQLAVGIAHDGRRLA